MIGQTLNNRYRLDRELGRGGMGAVYQGFDLLLNRVVAVKLLVSTDLDTQGKNDLLNEARAVAQLNHPNIVSVFDAGESADIPFVVMEYIEGDSLHDKPPADTAAIIHSALQICAALDEAHAHGIVHRDLKPENVITNENGLVKLTDFGLARSLADRMTQEGTLTGTVFYISPEQALGKPLDGRTDLYALGVMLYELFTGRLPFTAREPLAVIAQHINEKPQPPTEIIPAIPPALEAIILKLLAKHPDERFKSASEVRDVLEDFLAGIEYHPKPRVLHNIPIDLTSFIGREKEVAEVCELMRTCRLLTLTGVGGTGKTRLALQAARKLLDNFRDGVWVVELSTIFESGQVLRAVAGVLDMRDQPNRPLLDSLVDFLRPRNLLLILDNCEHLITACAGTTGHLLSSCPDLKIMATSRESLGVPGEITFHVPSMKQPDNDRLMDLEEIWEIESMQLFRDRVLSVMPDFRPDQKQTEAAAKICTRLDGIPLAIELAAARVRVMPVEEIYARLSDRFRLLTGGSRSAMPRQQTLEALIDWSYDLLTENEKVLLRRLSIFSGGWTLEEAEKICSDDLLDKQDILDVLARLVDKSLVNSDTRGFEARYAMLETIRQYARNKLIQSGESEAIRDRHMECYAEFADRVAPELWRGEQVKWMDRLEEDHDNLRAALEWSLCETCGKEHTLAGLRIAASIFVFWLVRGYWSEGLDWMLKLLAHPLIIDLKDPIKNRLIYSAGFITKELGDLHSARKYFEEALNAARQQQDQRTLAFALLGLGEIAMIERFSDKAGTLIDQSLTIFRSLDDQVGIALALSRKGGLTADRQGYEKAKLYYQENLAVCRNLGHLLGIAGTLMALGRIETYYGDKNQGRKYLEESLSIFRESKDKSGIAGALSAIGYADLYDDDLVSSKEKYEEVLRINRELRSSPGIGSALIALGEISRAQGDYTSAREYYEEALDINEGLGQVGIVMVVAHNLGYVAKQQGDLQQALNYFRRSLGLAKERGVNRFIYYCVVGIATVYVAMDRLEDAVNLFSTAEKMAQENTYTLDPVDHWEIKQSMKVLDEAMPEDRKNSLWKAGLKKSLENAISIAEDKNGREN
jgi:predicted ATPase/predicted Ser/Thr protein kinase